MFTDDQAVNVIIRDRLNVHKYNIQDLYPDHSNWMFYYAVDNREETLGEILWNKFWQLPILRLFKVPCPWCKKLGEFCEGVGSNRTQAVKNYLCGKGECADPKCDWADTCDEYKGEKDELSARGKVFTR